MRTAGIAGLLIGLVFGTAQAQLAPAPEEAVEEAKDAAAKADAAAEAARAAAKQADEQAQAAKKAADAVDDEPKDPDADGDEEDEDDRPDLSKTTKPNANVRAKPKDDGLPSWGALEGEGDGLPAWGDASTVPSVAPNWDAAAGPEAKVTFPWVESHGYFRVRTDLFHNFDLDSSSSGGERASPVNPPLTEINENGSGHPEDPAHRYQRGAETLASANIRFRYQPTLHIAENLRVKTTLDILDNLVLGSTPDGTPNNPATARPDVAVETFSSTQTPPEAGINGWRDGVRVKHLWGEWKTPLGLILAGRTMSHWGLGVLANNGNCLDCDFGDSVDRIMGVTKLFGTYLALAWDFPAEGATGFGDLETLQNQRLGQPYDLDNRDDVNEFVIAIFQRPVTKEEQELRARDLDENRKAAFDWGAYTVIRSQEFTSTAPNGLAASGTGYRLKDVKAFAFIPDLWARWEYRPRRGKKFRLEAELVGIFGVLEELPQRSGDPKVRCLDPTVDSTNIEDCPPDQRYEPRRRDLTQFGAALEFDGQVDRLKFGARTGIASGDDTDGFGVKDKIPLNSEDPTDDAVTNFRFDRDYHVDLILFREIIGTVTNAFYFKPYIGYDFIQTDTDAWGFQLATIYASALNPKATPGNEAPLGLEFDLELYMVEHDRFRWSLQYGLLFPFGAFDSLNVEETAVDDSPSVAQTLQMMLGMQF